MSAAHTTPPTEGPRPLFLAGQWRAAQSGAVFPTFDPATGAVIAEVARADAADVQLAVAAAREAFEDEHGWAHWAPAERARVLFRIADGIEARLEDLSHLETRDSGKPLWMSRLEVQTAANQFRYYAGWCTKLSGKTVVGARGRFSYVVPEPIGVCAGIAPWNYPIIMAAQKTAPALAVGNTVVFKPAEETPLTALEVARIASEAGLPDGALSVLTGFGEEAGEALVRHPDVRVVSFTGSTVVGRHIMRTGADTLKRVSLELGGKSPHIVLADADLGRAAAAAAEGVFLNAGQTCTAGTRIVVERPVYDEFMGRLVEATQALRVAPGLDPDAQIGPLISPQQRERVEHYVRLGQESGADLVLGGSRLEMPGHEGGWFYAPTIFGRVANSHAIAQEEIFGPVAVAEVVSDVDEAIAVANDSPYALAAGVWTTDLSAAHRVAERLRAGTVWVNCYGLFDPAMPFGGGKESGSGRELGEESLSTYMLSKSVWIDHG